MRYLSLTELAWRINCWFIKLLLMMINTFYSILCLSVKRMKTMVIENLDHRTLHSAISIIIEIRCIHWYNVCCVIQACVITCSASIRKWSSPSSPSPWWKWWRCQVLIQLGASCRLALTHFQDLATNPLNFFLVNSNKCQRMSYSRTHLSTPASPKLHIRFPRKLKVKFKR